MKYLNVFMWFAKRPILTIVGVGILYFLIKSKFSMKTVSSKGKTWLKVLEGWKTKAYRDSKGYWTIGGGHLIQKGEEYLKGVVDKLELEKLFSTDIQKHSSPVMKLQKAGVILTSYQVDAIISLTFNMGVSGFQKTKLYAYLLEKKKNFDMVVILDYFDNIEWTGRRKAEYVLFSTGKYTDSLGKTIN